MAANAPQSDNRLELSDLVAIVTGATAIIALLSTLAVTGALQKMQRDHGNFLVAAVALGLAGGMLWVLEAIWRQTAAARDRQGTRPESANHKWFQRATPWIQTAMLVGAVVCLFFAVILAVIGMKATQQEQDRPSVTAELDKGVLKVTASAHNLGTEARLRTQIAGLILTTEKGHQVLKPEARWTGFSGPDADGNVSQAFTWTLDDQANDSAHKYQAIEVTASSGEPTGCADELLPIDAVAPTPQPKQASLPGCVIIYLPGGHLPPAP
jgi:hypothetical protein